MSEERRKTLSIEAELNFFSFWFYNFAEKIRILLRTIKIGSMDIILSLYYALENVNSYRETTSLEWYPFQIGCAYHSTYVF